ncbi:MAG: nucleotidyltransferase family protein [Proteobacteria bacterium]|nr:nucleotidyltransferase family protein [Pseudomonadota bacterium]
MKAMILAAGRGERLRPLTDSIPKPLVSVAGTPLIVWHLRALARAAVREVVINLSWLGSQLRAALGDGGQFGVAIQYSDEGASALDVGGGIFNALPRLGPGPFLVVNGDVWSDLDFAALLRAPAPRSRLVLVPNPPQHPAGDFGLEGTRVTLRAQAPGRVTYTYSGIGVYRPELFDGCSPGRFALLPLLERAIGTGGLDGQIHHGRWCDVGTLGRLEALDRSLAQESRTGPAVE